MRLFSKRYWIPTYCFTIIRVLQSGHFWAQWLAWIWDRLRWYGNAGFRDVINKNLFLPATSCILWIVHTLIAFVAFFNLLEVLTQVDHLLYFICILNEIRVLFRSCTFVIDILNVYNGGQLLFLLGLFCWKFCRRVIWNLGLSFLYIIEVFIFFEEKSLNLWDRLTFLLLLIKLFHIYRLLTYYKFFRGAAITT